MVIDIEQFLAIIGGTVLALVLGTAFVHWFFEMFSCLTDCYGNCVEYGPGARLVRTLLRRHD